MKHSLVSCVLICTACTAQSIEPVRTPSARNDTGSHELAWNPYLYSAGFMAGFLPLLSFGGGYRPSAHCFAASFSRPPEWEDDPFIWNGVLHPLWGSETYLRAREAQHGMLGSFAFSMGASAAWEYCFESWIKHPSIQDLIFTTGVGWLIGEARYRAKRFVQEKWHWVVDPLCSSLASIRLAFGKHPDGSAEYDLAVEFSL